MGGIAQGSASWLALVRLYKAAKTFTEEQPGTTDSRPAGTTDEDILAKYPGTETKEELTKADVMTINADYRKAALKKLHDAWRYKLPKTSIPSYRLWGMLAKQKWLYGEYQPVQFHQLENAEKGKLTKPQTGERAQLRQDPTGSGWHQPPIWAAEARNQTNLEEALKVLHNAIILTGWVRDPQVVITWHHRFWSRAVQLSSPRQAHQIPHSIKDLMRAHLAFPKTVVQMVRGPRPPRRVHLESATGRRRHHRCQTDPTTHVRQPDGTRGRTRPQRRQSRQRKKEGLG